VLRLGGSEILDILKLGGSVITFKDRVMTPNKEAIRRLSREIAMAGFHHLVIVHGGGSYGHPLAKEHGIAQGFKSTEQLIGFSRTRQAMVDLNCMIVGALLDEGVPAVSLSPSTFISTHEGRLQEYDLRLVRWYLDSGMVPVMYGDAVLDSALGFTILSGDQLAVRLAIDLKADTLLFGVDVDGVYTGNPKMAKSAKLIEKLSLGQVRSIIGIGEATSTDVTGGMLGKIKEAQIAVEFGVGVQMMNALVPGRVFEALKGEPVVGTILTR
jgi:isopentenyl phosphate kinase